MPIARRATVLAGLGIDQDSSPSTVGGDAATADNTSGSRAGFGFKSSDPQIETVFAAGLGFLDGLISTMNGLVCFAIGPPGWRIADATISRALAETSDPLKNGVVQEAARDHGNAIGLDRRAGSVGPGWRRLPCAGLPFAVTADPFAGSMRHV